MDGDEDVLLPRTLAAPAPSGPAALVGDGVPFGMVRVRAAACTLCGACPDRCPTDALVLDEDAGASRLRFDHARCVACEACVQVCPERAIEVERRLDWTWLGRAVVVAEDEVARCRRCGAAIAPRSMLRKVRRSLGATAGFDVGALGRYCASCQMLGSVTAPA